MQEASDRVGVILVALVAAILYGISVLALWALGPAIAFTVLAAALYLEARSSTDIQRQSPSGSS
ncbi:MAG TPA: hypothetical protein VK215_02135 [Acidimicrobiales bacterium]|jgi:hypothetical protein|nr:hypothetical protein [Acidimicrobiales bacterium]HLN41220.1 hypothetical protein [Acidimicrobiales bacterium]